MKAGHVLGSVGASGARERAGASRLHLPFLGREPLEALGNSSCGHVACSGPGGTRCCARSLAPGVVGHSQQLFDLVRQFRTVSTSERGPVRDTARWGCCTTRTAGRESTRGPAGSSCGCATSPARACTRLLSAGTTAWVSKSYSNPRLPMASRSAWPSSHRDGGLAVTQEGASWAGARRSVRLPGRDARVLSG